MEVALSTTNTPLLCYRRSSNPALSYSLPFCAYKGFYVGCSPYGKGSLRNSKTSLNGFSCIPKKQAAITCHHFWLDGDQMHFGYELLKRKKLSRNTVVISELARAGISDAAYPQSDIKLWSKIRGMSFYAVTAVSAICLFVLMLVQHPFVVLLDRYQRKAHYFIAKVWATITVAPFFKIEYEGLENLPRPDTPVVYVSNHQSFLDIYTLLTLGRSFKFISKTAIFLFPIIGWAMYMLGVIPLKRMDSRSQLVRVFP
uniref:1-acyl-sn-glycerol-3-phosphate acyltransferase 1ic isoform X1 n=2 Tax=Rhizophora mucronata TaxID=61149 RepID=A0A2P2KLX4_RHIMU